ncbi:NAD-dependent epimerase/dehydratase family protein [Demequina sp.]|uniref:NAD-dependent epimerase/dehydratase family protein n=1 Tax=Demequina sp. TaxID=2050685 RepID=UPI003D0AEFE9
MKVVVTGASGNVGTALLRALGEAPDVTEVTGIARRTPRRVPPPPYDVAGWVRADVASPASFGALAGAMAGADAVVHLAWVIQPNHDREFLRQVNVAGTQRVLASARAAGVGHVVVASSVGAYSASSKDVVRDESWATGGIPGSEYSVDKAAVERVLDDHEREHPEVLITRLRPALIFQRAAGAEIIRYFVGSLAPSVAFRGNLPALPWPAGTRVQALHADDVAAAYLASVRLRRGGAFNVAADDVLTGSVVAELMAGGRLVETPTSVLRGAVSAAWNARVVPVSPGWVDMAAGSPIMSTARAKDVLGWAPRRSAYSTVEEVLAGMADGAGTASPVLRPRYRPK